MDISERIIKILHYIILKSIDNKNAGEYRNSNVLISGSNHRPSDLYIIEWWVVGEVKNKYKICWW